MPKPAGGDRIFIFLARLEIIGPHIFRRSNFYTCRFVGRWGNFSHCCSIADFLRAVGVQSAGPRHSKNAEPTPPL